MLFLCSLAAALLFAFFCNGFIKSKAIAVYCAAVALSVSTAFIGRESPLALVLSAVRSGAFATAFWSVVMWTGALPNDSKAFKKLNYIRGELSITAAILSLSHNFIYGKRFFVALFLGKLPHNGIRLAAEISVVLLIIMLPLTVMSIPAVRRKMKGKTWKLLQRPAYLFYALLYAHIFIIQYPKALSGNGSAVADLVVYSVVFFGYGIFRIKKAILRKSPSAKPLACYAGGAAIIAVIAAALFTVAARLDCFSPENMARGGMRNGGEHFGEKPDKARGERMKE